MALSPAVWRERENRREGVEAVSQGTLSRVPLPSAYIVLLKDRLHLMPARAEL